MSARTGPVLVASNRGPVTFREDDAGQLVSSRGQGGLVTALTGALETGGEWIAAAMTDGTARWLLGTRTDGSRSRPTTPSTTSATCPSRRTCSTGTTTTS